jgi:hypothetical protein
MREKAKIYIFKIYNICKDLESRSIDTNLTSLQYPLPSSSASGNNYVARESSGEDRLELYMRSVNAHVGGESTSISSIEQKIASLCLKPR